MSMRRVKDVRERGCKREQDEVEEGSWPDNSYSFVLKVGNGYGSGGRPLGVSEGFESFLPWSR